MSQEAISPVEELRLDAQDLVTLIKISTRPAVQSTLSSHLKRTERQIKRQEELIAEGDKLAGAAMWLIKSRQLMQAKLELSAAKSAYRRGAAMEKVDLMMALDDKIQRESEESAGRTEELMASPAREAGRGSNVTQHEGGVLLPRHAAMAAPVNAIMPAPGFPQSSERLNRGSLGGAAGGEPQREVINKGVASDASHASSDTSRPPRLQS